MRRPLKFALAVVAAFCLSSEPALAFESSTGDARNLVQVVNERNGAARTRAKAAVAENPGPSITNENVAIARSSCVDCRTVAAAIQVVVIEGPTNDFRPGNAAVAVNTDCLRCQTFAYARQEVLDAGRDIELSSYTKSRLESLQAEATSLAASNVAFDEMGAMFDSITLRMLDVVRADLSQEGASTLSASSRRKVRKNLRDA